MVLSTGQKKPVIDTEEQEARDALAYSERIANNIANLELAAEAARREGNPRRAELMEKRISGLERRLSEFETEQ